MFVTIKPPLQPAPLLNVYVYMCVKCVQVPIEVRGCVGSSGAGVSGSWEPPLTFYLSSGSELRYLCFRRRHLPTVIKVLLMMLSIGFLLCLVASSCVPSTQGTGQVQRRPKGPRGKGLRQGQQWQRLADLCFNLVQSISQPGIIKNSLLFMYGGLQPWEHMCYTVLGLSCVKTAIAR